MIKMSTAKEKVRNLPTLTDEEAKREIEKQKKLKQDAKRGSLDYEKNIASYFEQTEPIVNNEGVILALVRYPSYDELIDLVPPELREYADKPQDIPPELEEKYSEAHFKIMAELIVEPKHTAEWWRSQKGVMRFVALFNAKLSEIVKKTTEQAENFPTQPKG